MKQFKFKKILLILSLIFILTSFTACKIEKPNKTQTTSDLTFSQETEETSSVDSSSKGSINVDDLDDSSSKDLSKYDDNSVSSKYIVSTWNHDNDKNNIDFNDDDGDGRDDNTGLDEYLTDPTPAGKPKPVEPENTEITKTQKHCTLSIRMDTILDNVDSLDSELKYMLDQEPMKSGVIYAKKQIIFYEGESVFDVLLRETKTNGIHMEFTFTPMYNSSYIEGINNFYEFSCGELSGWMYCVNGWYPNYGCSRYLLKEGDEIEFNYTCDLGRDLKGGEWLGEAQ